MSANPHIEASTAALVYIAGVRPRDAHSTVVVQADTGHVLALHVPLTDHAHAVPVAWAEDDAVPVAPDAGMLAILRDAAEQQGIEWTPAEASA